MVFLLLACSGPGANDVILRSALIGLGAAMVLPLLLWASLRIARRGGRLRRMPLLPGAALALLLLTGLGLGVVSGDCGYTVRSVAYAAVLLACTGVAVQAAANRSAAPPPGAAPP